MNRWRFLSVAFAAIVLLAAGLMIVRIPTPMRPPTDGISEELARDRAARISTLSYELRLRVPGVRTEAIRGEITAAFTLSSVSRPLVFDFDQPADRLLSVVANGHNVAATIDRGHVMIPAEMLVRGQNRISFAFLAGDEALNRQDDFLYSLFVPARARRTFPCFDQPDLKARWQLAIDVPPGWSAVSNGREAGRTTAPDHVGYLFDETPPISTYLFAVAAGRFSIDTAERGGRSFRMFHRETDAAKVARNRDAIFDLHAQALSWLETYTDIAYPFAKFDFVLIPSFQFGGMEHPGSVFYNANGLLLDQTATQSQYLARANLIAHETAHMWFGDLVTMTWFNDVWMKEVFANFMAAKIVNPSFPDVNHDLRFLVQHYPAAYDIDRTDGANPVRQSLSNLDSAGSLYGAIIYQKAPIVMRQLERLIGADTFRDGLRTYLSLHGFANADWPDLIRILDARSPLDLQAWSHAWIDEAGRPTITTDLRLDGDTIEQLAFRQRDVRQRDLRWVQALQVAVGDDKDIRFFDVTTTDVETEVPATRGLPAPDWILPVGGGLGYGKFDLDARTLASLTNGAHHISDPVLRGAAFIALWEAMLDGQVPSAVLRRKVVSALPDEDNELDLQLLLDQLRILFWRFTPEVERFAVAAEIEPVLRAGLNNANTTSVKAAWFGTLRSVALTPATLVWLEDVWARKRRIEGLPLSEVDESDLALDLAVRDIPAAESVLATQLDRITNPDRRARLEFITPALSRDPVVRQQFFDRLKEPKHRARESWVLDAVRYLHHPLRSAASARMVRPALEMLLDIQRTGDIFFPKRWADATLGGHNSALVADDVKAFIDGLPRDYPVRLRWVLIASADPLLRAARLR